MLCLGLGPRWLCFTSLDGHTLRSTGLGQTRCRSRPEVAIGQPPPDCGRYWGAGLTNPLDASRFRPPVLRHPWHCLSTLTARRTHSNSPQITLPTLRLTRRTRPSSAGGDPRCRFDSHFGIRVTSDSNPPRWVCSHWSLLACCAFKRSL